MARLRRRRIARAVVQPADMVVSQELVQAAGRLETCRFRPRLKAGMTREEAYDAMDTAWNAFLGCLRNRFRTSRACGSQIGQQAPGLPGARCWQPSARSCQAGAKAPPRFSQCR